MICLAVLVSLVALSCAAPNSQAWVSLQEAAKVEKDTTLKFHSFRVENEWNKFKTVHGKHYESSEEELKRKEIFGVNLKQIEFHNYLHSKGIKPYKLSLNEYADMEHGEFVHVMNGLRPRNFSMAHDRLTYMSPMNIKMQLPDKVDWRDRGYVTPVKNQGRCGSCWSFSTTGALEGQHYRKTGKLVSLSEQNLVDCSSKWGNHGCNGGLMDQAFQYIKDNDGVDTEKSYPYVGKVGICHFKTRNVGATDQGFTDVMPRGDEDKLKEAVATVGPVSIAIDASHPSFQLYDSGVYDEPECSSTKLDHGVLVVGYGTKDGEDYWIVKNSWGPTWGLNGYVYMSRNKNNQCGVASMASYPNV